MFGVLTALAIAISFRVLRFMAAFEHTYEVFPIDTPLPKRDRAHEQAHTFSNPISKQYWLNLLLNFGYHNVHHGLIKCPWYSLHELERELFAGMKCSILRWQKWF